MIDPAKISESRMDYYSNDHQRVRSTLGIQDIHSPWIPNSQKSQNPYGLLQKGRIHMERTV